jgi:hypothetical protein
MIVGAISVMADCTTGAVMRTAVEAVRRLRKIWGRRSERQMLV